MYDCTQVIERSTRTIDFVLTKILSISDFLYHNNELGKVMAPSILRKVKLWLGEYINSRRVISFSILDVVPCPDFLNDILLNLGIPKHGRYEYMQGV